jgi:hypothetical protein
VKLEEIILNKVNILNKNKEYHNNVNAESFNKHFLTIAKNISCKITRSNKQIITCAEYSPSYLSQVFNFPFNNIVFHNTSMEEIEKIIHSFPWKNSCGYDEISMKIMKVCAPFINSPLCRINDTSLNSSVSHLH